MLIQRQNLIQMLMFDATDWRMKLDDDESGADDYDDDYGDDVRMRMRKRIRSRTRMRIQIRT